MTDYTNLRKIVTGDIIIKCRLGNEIRRIPINQTPTYDELCLMMYRVFRSQITNPENIVLKYMDNEGDMISLLDDNDITHAISISSLLKITVYNKTSSSVTASQSIDEIQTTLTQLRDQIDDLIKSFKPDTKQEKQIVDVNKQETSKPTRKLTSAELAQFLSDDNTTKKVEKSSPVKELSTLSPSNHIPYYPPPSSSSSSQPQSQPQIKQSVQQQPAKQQPVQQPVQPLQQQPAQQPTTQQQQNQQQQNQQHNQQHYIQTPPSAGIPSTPTSQQHQHQRPVSLQHPSPYPPSIQHQPQYGSPNYPPPPPSNNTANDPRLQQQQQQQQPPRQAYYVPPPPSSMNQTPQLPPQPYNPTARW